MLHFWKIWCWISRCYLNYCHSIDRCFFSQDLQKMKIGMQHRNKIWRSLVEFRNGGTLSNQSQAQVDLQGSGSQASTVSFGSAQNNGYCPEFYEVTRYTFKQFISLDGGDHSYCWRGNCWQWWAAILHPFAFNFQFQLIFACSTTTCIVIACEVK